MYCQEHDDRKTRDMTAENRLYENEVALLGKLRTNGHRLLTMHAREESKEVKQKKSQEQLRGARPPWAPLVTRGFSFFISFSLCRSRAEKQSIRKLLKLREIPILLSSRQVRRNVF